MHRVLISGSLAFDRIMDFPGRFEDHILPDMTHAISVSFLVENLKESYGGTAGNIAYNIALLGGLPLILASAGNDFEPYRKWLESNNIPNSLIETHNGERTAFATILTDKENNQIAAFYPGAMKKTTYERALGTRANIAIVGAGNTDDMRQLPGIFKENNIPYLFDPAQQIPTLSAEDLKNGIEGSRVFISNDYELALTINKTGWDENEIMKHTKMLVTTFGGSGARIKTEKETLTIPAAKPKNAKDPTGAGDGHRAGFITGLLNEWPLEATGKFASVIACYTIEVYGTQTHWFSKDDVRERYKENFGEYPPAW